MDVTFSISFLFIIITFDFVHTIFIFRVLICVIIEDAYIIFLHILRYNSVFAKYYYKFCSHQLKQKVVIF